MTMSNDTAPPPAAAAAAAAAAATSKDASFPAARSPLGAGISVVEIDKRRGRGVLATRFFEADDEIYRAQPDLAVLYSDHASTHCVRCFRGLTELSKRKVQLHRCSLCDAFAVCHECSAETDRDSAPLWKDHKQVCAWYVTLPAAVRKGDTDYVRFLLEYSARVQQGDVALIHSINACCSLEDEHSTETKRFATQYATITVNQFGPHGLRTPFEVLREVLLKVKANALGFPFSARETLGWAMEGTVCAVNHSCVPNAALQQSPSGEMVLRALAPITAGEEITISYVHVPDHPDVKERRRLLLDKYRFLCMCPACCNGTPPSVKGTPVKRSPDRAGRPQQP
jgi:hypothetical protein